MHTQPKFKSNQFSEALYLDPLSIQDIVNKELSLIGTTADETLHMVSNVLQLLMRTGDPNSMTLQLSSSETLGFYNILGLVNAALEFEHDRIQALDIEAA
jgi:hypothetical protein